VNKDNYLQKEKKSFGHAFRGVAIFFAETSHAKIHLLATILVIIAGFWFDVNTNDWLALILAMALVWVAEAFNSAIEYVVDLASPEYHILAKKAKDVAAGAVLIASLFAVVVAVLVFFN
jgi:diacylglycerol kinase